MSHCIDIKATGMCTPCVARSDAGGGGLRLLVFKRLTAGARDPEAAGTLLGKVPAGLSPSSVACPDGFSH